jgi:hypothetical protein
MTKDAIWITEMSTLSPAQLDQSPIHRIVRRVQMEVMIATPWSKAGFQTLWRLPLSRGASKGRRGGLRKAGAADVKAASKPEEALGLHPGVSAGASESHIQQTRDLK